MVGGWQLTDPASLYSSSRPNLRTTVLRTLEPKDPSPLLILNPWIHLDLQCKVMEPSPTGWQAGGPWYQKQLGQVLVLWVRVRVLLLLLGRVLRVLVLWVRVVAA